MLLKYVSPTPERVVSLLLTPQRESVHLGGTHVTVGRPCESYAPNT